MTNELEDGDRQKAMKRLRVPPLGAAQVSICSCSFGSCDLFNNQHRLLGGFPGGASGKESTYQCRRSKKSGFTPWVRKIPWSRKWQTTPVFLPGKFHGQRSLVGYGPWGSRELDLTEHVCMHVRAHTHRHTHTHTVC